MKKVWKCVYLQQWTTTTFPIPPALTQLPARHHSHHHQHSTPPLMAKAEIKMEENKSKAKGDTILENKNAPHVLYHKMGWKQDFSTNYMSS